MDTQSASPRNAQPPARELHPLEIRVLLHATGNAELSQASLISELSYNTGQANQALSWLAAKGFAAEKSRATRVLYEITDFGKECLEKGTYEERIIRLIDAEGPMSPSGDREEARAGAEGRRLRVRRACKGKSAHHGRGEARCPGRGRQGFPSRLLRHSPCAPCEGGGDGGTGREDPCAGGEGPCRFPREKEGKRDQPVPAGGAGRGELRHHPCRRTSAPAARARRDHRRRVAAP